ncbi:molybdopterin-dependent oxidoreductase [Streptomyces sp. NPDC058001]|uniref:molybdopterin-dependent oxidoreductase n=1 Tax=Streptomyces sp. NPDC058001 TaxID=3346300 RepID=UPI0036ED2B98
MVDDDDVRRSGPERSRRGTALLAPLSSALSSPRSPTSPAFWRSPLRGPWFTSLLGVVLLVGITVVSVTGLVSYAAYNPNLTPVNDQTPDKGLLGFYLFEWPTNPYWLYRLTQGVHVTLGLVLIPVLLAKLWSVVPKLFALPPARSVGHALERISLLLLVGGVLFEFATGVLNIQLDYLFPGSFYPLHFYGAWVFLAGFVVHVALRAPMAFRVLRSGELRSNERELVSPDPLPATLSRRGALGVVGAGSLLILVTSAGQSIGGSLRRTALLAPHGGPEPRQAPGGGFQVNKTAASVGVGADETGDNWRLTVDGPGGRVVLTRADLLGMPQHTAALPIACVEGWSTDNQHWTGVRLRDLAALVGYAHTPAPDVFVESLQRAGAFRAAGLTAHQVRDERSLLALRVNGYDLTLDHGYPARVIVPAAPGVMNTKWVTRMRFETL